MKKGFTLIELLVVVLIIGILAAIALPMYTKTVKKARAQQVIVAVKALADSAQRYVLENDIAHNCSLDWENDLDIEVPQIKDWSPQGMGCNGSEFKPGEEYIRIKYDWDQGDWDITMTVYADGSVEGMFCGTDSPLDEDSPEDREIDALCKSLGFTKPLERDTDLRCNDADNHYVCWVKS